MHSPGPTETCLTAGPCLGQGLSAGGQGQLRRALLGPAEVMLVLPRAEEWLKGLWEAPSRENDQPNLQVWSLCKCSNISLMFLCVPFNSECSVILGLQFLFCFFNPPIVYNQKRKNNPFATVLEQ